MAKKMALLLAEGFEEVEAVTPVDFLRRANIDVIIVGIGGILIKGARGITIKADCPLDEFSDRVEGIIIPGGMPGATNIAACEQAVTLIKKLRDEGKLVAAICAAPFVVLETRGIASGVRITGYPSFKDKFQKNTYGSERVVVDGKFITSQGPGSAAEFAIRIIESLAGKSASDQVFAATLQK